MPYTPHLLSMVHRRLGFKSVGSAIFLIAIAIVLSGCTTESPTSEVGVSREAVRVMSIDPPPHAPLGIATHPRRAGELENTDLQESIARLAPKRTDESIPQIEANGSEQELRAALTTWAAQLRAALMPGMHTVVEGLVDDADCAGDIVADRMFERYFDALFTPTEDQRAQIVAALSALARQSACLGSRQSAVLASAIYSTYSRVRDELHESGSDDVLPYLAQAVSQPILLFYDVEKYRGATSPLARWFAENRNFLTQGVWAKRHPAMWHGLWLYDRRSGHLLGYHHTNAPHDENDIDLARFWTSISSLENLGDYTCSFMEMVGRGAGSVGYFCGGSKCAGKQSGFAGRTNGRLASGASSATKLSIMGASPPNSLPASSDTCQESSPGGGDSANGGVCGQGLGIGGDRLGSEAIRCLTSQIVRPGTEMMKCVSEAMGLCSNPVDKLTKDLRETEFAGVKVGASCQISAGMGDVKAAEQKKQEEAAADLAAKKQAADKAQAEAEAALKAAEENAKKAEEAKQALDAAEKAGTATQADRNGVWLLSVLSSVTDLAFSKAVANMQQADKDYMDAKDKYEQNYGGNKGRCPQDTPDCGNNNCTGMSDSMRQTLDCIKQATESQSRDPFDFQHGGCDPKYCDPMDPDLGPHASALMSCFAPMDDGVEAAVAKRCWAVDCPRDGAAVLTASGLCSCRPVQEGSPQGHLLGMCSMMYCADGNPKVGPFGCTCEDSTASPMNPPSGGSTLPGIDTKPPVKPPGSGPLPDPTQPGPPSGPWPF